MLETYRNFDPMVLEKVWQLKMKVLKLIVKCEGGNEYKLPHGDIE